MRGGVLSPPRIITMLHACFLLLACVTQAPTLSMRCVALVGSGPLDAEGRLICYDSDHDSMPELIFKTYDQHTFVPRIEFWEYEDWNRFRLVYADTGATFPEPNGITTGNAVPYDAGDVDGDGLTDIVCGNTEFFNLDSAFSILMTLESPDSHSYPCSLSWYWRGPINGAGTLPSYIRYDFEHDGRNVIVGAVPGLGGVWKNVGNDSNVLAWNGRWFGGSMAFGDFCGDGGNYVTNGAVWEDIGNCQFEMIWVDTVVAVGNGHDVRSTSDIDGDGRLEFYVVYMDLMAFKLYLYMYEDESDGKRQFTSTLVDTMTFKLDDGGSNSSGGDIDGDGVDECIWTTCDSVRVYKAFGNNDLRQVWGWQCDLPRHGSRTTTVHDVNNDGYNELVIGGGFRTAIFEVDAVDLLSPNGGSCGVGDTVPIRWAVNTPPRCDSLSLFLRRDSSWLLDTIVRGLPGADTLYRWVVPSGVPDTGRIVVMAYGPGHQWDISDSVITFIGGGVADGTRRVPLQWSLSVSPNPARGAFTVRYDVPGFGAKAPVFALGIYDAGGRLVRLLCEGDVVPGRYEVRLPSGVLPAGIYFLRLDTPGFRAVKKAVVAR
jgi:hypothetical protein